MKQTITCLLVIAIVVSCSKEPDNRPVKQERLTNKILAGDTGITWKAQRLSWNERDTSKNNGKEIDYEAVLAYQAVTFRPDNSYSCTDSIAQFLLMPKNGTYHLDTARNAYPIYITGGVDLETSMPTENEYKGMLALVAEYYISRTSIRRVAIWLKKVE